MRQNKPTHASISAAWEEGVGIGGDEKKQNKTKQNKTKHKSKKKSQDHILCPQEKVAQGKPCTRLMTCGMSKKQFSLV